MKRTPTPDRLAYKSFYRRNLPHVQPVNATLFVTFRLHGSLPQSVLDRMSRDHRALSSHLQSTDAASQSRYRQLARRYFATLEACLDRAESGPTWLANPEVANVVVEALHYRDNTCYRLDAFSIMPNHVHAVFAPFFSRDDCVSLSSIMHSLKRNTAKRANQIIVRSGSFWQHETFDHYIRTRREWLRTIKYVLNNPVKAGLVRAWQDWQWNYVREGILEA